MILEVGGLICKNCHGNVKSDFKFCPFCGQRVVNDFRDQYEELSPPYVISPAHVWQEEEDTASAYYAGAPREQVPEFDGQARGPFKNSPPYESQEPSYQEADYEGRYQRPSYQNLEKELPRHQEPEYREQGYSTAEYEESAGVYDEPEAPYFVYHPQETGASFASGYEEAGKENYPPPLDEYAPPSRLNGKFGPDGFAAQQHGQGKKRKLGIGWKILIILLILVAGVGGAVFLFQMLMTPDPFANFNISSLFTRFLFHYYM